MDDNLGLTSSVNLELLLVTISKSVGTLAPASCAPFNTPTANSSSPT